MMATRTYLFSLFIFLATGSLATGQSQLPLPKVLPSYSEDFSHLRSFPSMCFDDAFLDKSGKLWLKPCTNTQTGLHLFQFDGYEFRMMRGVLDSIPTNIDFNIFEDRNVLIGFITNPGEQKVVYYYFDTGEVATLPYPMAGEVQRFWLLPFGPGGALALGATETQLFLHELHDGAFTLRQQLDIQPNYSYAFSTELNQIGADFCYYHRQSGDLHLLDIATGLEKIYPAAEYDPTAKPAADGSLLIIGQHYANGRYYFSKTNDGGKAYRLFYWDSQRELILPVAGIPTCTTKPSVFSDEAGNVLFIFKTANNQLTAILEDTAGKRYDYSAFFTDQLLDGAMVRNLISHDFKKQLLVCHSKGILLQTVQASDAIQRLMPNASMRAMLELPGRRILLATQGDGVGYIYDANTQQLERWEHPACRLAWPKLFHDDAGHVWAIADDGFARYDPSTNICEQYPAGNTKGIFAFDGDNQIAFLTAGTPQQLALFDVGEKTARDFAVNDAPLQIQGYVHDMLFARDGTLWIATTKGLVGVDLEQGTARVVGNGEPFLDNRFLCIHEDDQGRLWLGTPLGGLHIYDPETGELKLVNSDNGLANNTVVSILADDDGDRWVGTYNGISIISAEGELIANLYEKDGLVDRECNRYSYLKMRDGTLLIGTVAGLNIIEPRQLKQRLNQARESSIYLTEISYFEGGRRVTKQQGLHDLGTLVLPAAQRSLRLKFALSNYFNPENNQYAYQLEGISEDWIPTGSQQILNLNNLPAGRYRLLIRGSSGTGAWTSEPIVISISAKEYFYRTIWFYLLCLVVLGGLALLWIYRLRVEVKNATQKIREDKAIIERQAKRLMELDASKSRFFTNISHEFRTPLTIIAGMIDQVKEKPELWLERGAGMIKQNTIGLLNLVNQILDLRKLESNELKVEMVQGDVVHYLRYIIESYRSYAANQGLQLHFLAAEPAIHMDHDPDKLLRIVSNLLSNALKFTPPEGHIYFHIDQKADGDQRLLHLRVQDTGVGIPPEDLPYIFGRFYQVDDSATRQGEGTGIGLALTQELVKLLGGDIKVESAVGVGSTFHVSLPITTEAPAEAADSLAEEKIETMTLAGAAPVLSAAATSPITSVRQAEGAPTLLIVEDNPDVRQFLIACLQAHYQLETAANGREGIDKAIELVPDLIVSDVMMPEKDGYELTASLKQDERTDHIPIVLLTAKADQESKISGLEKGADAYLSKPFEERELLVRLEKLLGLRKKLQARYALISFTDRGPAQVEDPFLQKFLELVEKELSNPDLDMNQLSRSLGMSRSQVFRKLKALTGQSATVFIRSIRLQHAKQLLDTSELTISEIAYEVGFTSLNYFSAAFLEAFGERPSATRK